MDKYIVERRARVRLAWFRRHEEIGNVSQVCREFGISRQTFLQVVALLCQGRTFGA